MPDRHLPSIPVHGNGSARSADYEAFCRARREMLERFDILVVASGIDPEDLTGEAIATGMAMNQMGGLKRS